MLTDKLYELLSQAITAIRTSLQMRYNKLQLTYIPHLPLSTFAPAQHKMLIS
ncbi:hypothetical protein GGR35_001824 [Mucilaginibacter phyllosphaerae]|uniref:Uncharacterized protein n=1 Tax=Mucilaginibacter phyllosphaerae TaxID=1812349 RepID=A0ABR6I853_9SPHI|nr:hypothetical protein [Mucilaginibacter phyllosphaerae]